MVLRWCLWVPLCSFDINNIRLRKGCPMMQRQGDLLIVKVQALPASAKLQKSRVLAEGEATGHLHELDENSDVFEENGVLYFRVKGNSPSLLKHPEHHTLTFEPGEYRVIRQREYEPNRWRNAHD